MLSEILFYLDAAGAGSARAGWQAALLTFSLIYCVLTAIVLWRIDLREHRLPDKIVLPAYLGVGIPLWLVCWLNQDIVTMRHMAYGAVFAGGVYFLLRKLSRNALGLGDVKLAGVIGLMTAYFSPLNLLWANLLAFLLGGLAALALVVTRRASAKTHIAFGPFMLLGALVAVFFPV